MYFKGRVEPGDPLHTVRVYREKKRKEEGEKEGEGANTSGQFFGRGAGGIAPMGGGVW